MKYILGSGLIGLLARHILGPSYVIIPYYKSRFFSYNPSLDDNFLVRDERTDPFIINLNGKLGPVYLYTKAWSVNGGLAKQYDKELCHSWLYKIFGQSTPTQSQAYMTGHMEFFVYDLRLNQLYQRLMEMYASDIGKGIALGQVSEIGDHYINVGGKKLEFSECISTIPLNSLCKQIGIKHNLKAKTLHYLHIETDDLDFEGSNQVLVVDHTFDFFKVTNVAPKRYLIYSHIDIPNPGVYFMQFMNKFEIIDGTSISDALPSGEVPQMPIIEKMGITCVGSNAQWDWCMDVSSCIIRLLRLADRKEATSIVNI